MAIETDAAGRTLPRVGLATLRRHWRWYFGLGLALVVLGFIAIGYSAATAVVTALFIGWLLVIGGVAQIVHGFWRREWGGFFLDLAFGVLYFVVGFLMVANPLQSALTLTLLTAAFLFAGGMFRSVMAVAVRYPNWGWMLLSGLVSLVLGVMIWQSWPASALWVIGLYVGIEMLFNGITLIVLGLAARKLPESEVRRPRGGEDVTAPREPLHA